MERNEDFVLVGHLQVLDEDLSSLYSDRKSGRYFLFVRLYEDNDDDTFLLAQVTPSAVLDYMNGHIGLKYIFGSSPAFYYRHKGQQKLNSQDFTPIGSKRANDMLLEDGLEDTYNSALATNSVGIKNYLRHVI